MYVPKIALALMILALAAPLSARDPQEAPVADPEPSNLYFQFNSQNGHDGAYLGVQLEEETDHEEGGALVTEVVSGSPADTAGLQEDDVVIEFGGRTIRGPLGLTKRIHEQEPGDSVEIVVRRDGKRETLEAELGNRQTMWAPRGFTVPSIDLSELEQLREFSLSPMRLEGLQERLGLFSDCDDEDDCPLRFQNYSLFFDDKPVLGVELIDTTPELREHLGGSREQGLLIGKVMAGTPAERAGIEVGDLILAVGGDEVASTGELRHALARRKGETFDIELVRDGERRSVSVTLVEEEEDRPTGPRARLWRHAAPAPPAMPTPASVVAPTPPPAPPVPAPAAPRPPRDASV